MWTVSHPCPVFARLLSVTLYNFLILYGKENQSLNLLLLRFRLGIWLFICSKATAEIQLYPFCQIGPERYTPASLVSHISPKAALHCPHPLTLPLPPSLRSAVDSQPWHAAFRERQCFLPLLPFLLNTQILHQPPPMGTAL